MLIAALTVLHGCEGDRLDSGELSNMKNVQQQHRQKHINEPTTPIDTSTAIQATFTETKNNSQDRADIAPALDTAVHILNYKDSIKGGFEVVDTVRNIDIIIIHSSYYVGTDTFSTKGIISQYEQYGVNAHYLLGREGQIFRLVDENNMAYHAGESVLPAKKKRTHLNKWSIGIEVMSTERNAPTEKQYEALVKLVNNIRARYPIKYIYRHSDIAPGRKTDPWCFDWDMFLKRLKFNNPDPETGNIDVNDEVDEIIKQQRKK